jgi:folate-dependent phosphoribosylglycinamide formyltransferase PurN
VIASRPGIGAVARGEKASVPVAVLPPAGEVSDPAAPLLEELTKAQADLVVLAGFLRLVPSSVVGAYRGRMVNIHPALLPAFGGSGMYGRRVHEAVLRSGARVTGVTVHFVDEMYDHGAIIAQWPVPVLEEDDAPALAARVLGVEHRLLPSVVHAMARGWVSLTSEGRCVWSRPLYGQDRFGMPMDGAIRPPGAEPATR